MIDFGIFMLKCFTLSAATCSGVIPNLSAALTHAEFSIKTSTQLLDLKKNSCLDCSALDNSATAPPPFLAQLRCLDIIYSFVNIWV